MFSIDFELYDQIRIQINQNFHGDTDSNDKFGSKKSIKRWFESNFRQILGLSQFNHLSLLIWRYNQFSSTSKSIKLILSSIFTKKIENWNNFDIFIKNNSTLIKNWLISIKNWHGRFIRIQIWLLNMVVRICCHQNLNCRWFDLGCLMAQAY